MPVKETGNPAAIRSQSRRDVYKRQGRFRFVWRSRFWFAGRFRFAWRSRFCFAGRLRFGWHSRFRFAPQLRFGWRSGGFLHRQLASGRIRRLFELGVVGVDAFENLLDAFRTDTLNFFELFRRCLLYTSRCV